MKDDFDKRIERVEKELGSETVKLQMADGTIKLITERRLMDALVEVSRRHKSEDAELVAASVSDDCSHYLANLIRVWAAARRVAEVPVQQGTIQ